MSVAEQLANQLKKTGWRCTPWSEGKHWTLFGGKRKIVIMELADGKTGFLHDQDVKQCKGSTIEEVSDEFSLYYKELLNPTPPDLQ